MRFYDLQTTPVPAVNGVCATPSGTLPANGAKSLGVARQWTSFPNGKFDPQAQDIVFDLQISPGHIPSGGTVISVHGVSIEDLTHANNFRGSALSLYAGMSGGLPLSTAQPSPGLLINATVLGAFGNWQGTEQTLDLVINPSTYTPHENPGNLVFNWQPGQSFADAITLTMSAAFPNSTLSIHVNPSLTTGQTILHFTGTANAMAQFIFRHTVGKNELGPNYPGVHIYYNGSKITVTDFSQSAGPVIALKFTDLVGQPTWLEPPVLTINTVLRADLQVGSYLTLPKRDFGGPGAVLMMPTIAGTQFDNKLNFSGTFIVTALRALGQFRGTDADDWISVIQAVPLEAIGAV